jgi:hypothetical protein
VRRRSVGVTAAVTSFLNLCSCLWSFSLSLRFPSPLSSLRCPFLTTLALPVRMPCLTLF